MSRASICLHCSLVASCPVHNLPPLGQRARLINYVRTRKGSLQSKACHSLIAFSFSIDKVHESSVEVGRRLDTALTCHL